jgi:hypothetical protein
MIVAACVDIQPFRHAGAGARRPKKKLIARR